MINLREAINRLNEKLTVILTGAGIALSLPDASAENVLEGVHHHRVFATVCLLVVVMPMQETVNLRRFLKHAWKEDRRNVFVWAVKYILLLMVVWYCVTRVWFG